MTDVRPAPVRAARAFAPFLVALLVYLAWYGVVHVPGTLAGDEPHYVLLSQSLVRDHDLDVADEYSAAPGLATGAQVFDARGDGRLRSIRQPGLPLLLAPIRALTDSGTALRLLMVLLTAVLAHQSFRLLEELGLARRRRLAWLAWAGCFLTLPMLLYSSQIYPEVPAALLAVVGVRALLRSRPGSAAPLAVVAFAGLPLLIIRFLPLAAALTAVAMWRAATSEPGWRARASSGSEGMRRAVVTAAPLVVVLAGLGLLFLHLYGSPSPTAAYPKGTTSAPSLLHAYRYGLGSLLSSSSGLLPYGPFLWLGLAGVGAAIVRFRAAGLIAAIIGAVHLFGVSPLGFFGYTMPGRFAIILVPMLLVGALAAIVTSRVVRVVALVLLVGSVGLSALASRHYDQLYDLGYPRFGPVLRTEAMWPRFSERRGVPELLYSPDTLTGEVGGLLETPKLVFRAARPGEAGLLTATTEAEIAPGQYDLAIFTAGDGPPGDEALRLEVRDARDQWSIASTDVAFGEAGTLAAPATIHLSFAMSEPTFVTIRATTTGKGVAAVGFMRVVLRHGGEAPDAPIRDDLPLGLAWVAVTALVAALVAARPDRERETSR